jgi:malate permease and related proteins
MGILMILLSASKALLKWITPLEWKAELKKSLGSLF